MHQRDGLNRDFRLIEELQFLAALGAILLCHAPGMGGDALAFLDGRGRHRESLAQMHLRWVGLGGEALALLAKDLTAEPIKLVRQCRDRSS